MKLNQLQFKVLLFQAIYFMITAMWPLVHIESFMMVTGYKIDQWLVKTVSLLIASCGITMIITLIKKRLTAESFPSIILAPGFLMIIDIYYAAIDRIWNVYLGDAAIEFLLILFWTFNTRGLKEFFYDPEYK